MIFDQQIFCKPATSANRNLMPFAAQKRIQPNICPSADFFLLSIFRVQIENRDLWAIIGKSSYLFWSWEKTDQKKILILDLFYAGNSWNFTKLGIEVNYRFKTARFYS